MARSAFGGGDQSYLRDVQYRDSSNLRARARLHERYATASVPWPVWLAQRIDWPADGRVLEVGCGPGRFWTEGGPGLPRSLDITVTDLSAGMVAEAIDRNREAGYRSFTGRVCDVQRLPFPDGVFDIVLADHMLYHVPDPDLAVAELARVLHPEGVLLAATNGRGHMQALRDVVVEVFAAEESDLYEVFGVETGERRLADHFSYVTWHGYENDLVVTEPADVVAYIRSYPPGDAATEEQVTTLEHAVERRFAAEDGVFRIRAVTGAFVAGGPISASAVNRSPADA